MGHFRITVNAVGGHGCERDVKDGGVVYGCGQQDCPDCLTARFLADMRRATCSIESATLQHWPGSKEEVVDTFDTEGTHIVSTRIRRKRTGSF